MTRNPPHIMSTSMAPYSEPSINQALVSRFVYHFGITEGELQLCTAKFGS